VPQLVELNQITAQAALSGLKLKYAVAEKVPTADTTSWKARCSART
jgi:hypothetical protein